MIDRKVDRQMTLIDEDEDGKISQEEATQHQYLYPTFNPPKFVEFDVNSDGFVTRQELWDLARKKEPGRVIGFIGLVIAIPSLGFGLYFGLWVLGVVLTSPGRVVWRFAVPTQRLWRRERSARHLADTCRLP